MKTNLIHHLVSKRECENCRNARAFTLIELLVVIGVVALLVATLSPTLAGSRVGSQAFRCQNNNRQLSAAWRMYADDNNDRLVYASAINSGPPPTPNPPDSFAWTGAHMGESPQSPPRWEWDPSIDMMKRPLWKYAPNAGIYRCPSDHSVDPTASGLKPRILSFSMNLYVGGFAPNASAGEGPDGTDGGWGFANTYRIFSKTTDLIAPGPAKTFVFIDMRPEAINWGNFLTYMYGFPNNPSQYEFSDFPGIYHNLGACFSFGDGHAEVHRWLDPRTAPPLTSSPISSFPSPNNVDIAWLQAHSTSLK